MLAITAARIDPSDPLSGLEVGPRPEPTAPPGWTTVTVKAASLNHHDLWTLRGVGIKPERLPVILGTDAAGIAEDGSEVVVHAIVGDPDAGGGDETLDPAASILSEVYDGTLAERVVVPRRNLVPKPAELSWAEAACLPTAWLTAYRMLATRSGLRPGNTVLIQGAGGGVATALVSLAGVMGIRAWVTSRDEAKGERAVGLGAAAWFPSGARLPERVDAVMETVGEATWAHSLRALKPGGRIVVCGATSGFNPPGDLARVYYLQLSVVGSTMGTRSELMALLSLLSTTGLRPQVDRVLPLAAARDGLAALAAGDVFGKIVLVND
jgi:NADPH:quinone reductase-like Zn-dependent oxidoreductase